MPPKKKPEKKKVEDEPVSYNTDDMTVDQMKEYAHLLEGEIEDMRRHCNFYQKADDELVELIRIAEEDSKYEEEILVSKDVKLENTKLKFLQHLREKRELLQYMEHNRSEKKEKLSLKFSECLKEEQNRHMSEVKKLNLILLAKNRQIEALNVKIEMDQREAKERNENCLKSIDSTQNDVLEQVLKTYGNVKSETDREFKNSREMIHFEALEKKVKGEQMLNEACMSFKQNMHKYFKEATKQDLDTIKNLKNKIMHIEESIKNYKMLLKKAKEECKNHKKCEIKIRKRASEDIVVKFNACPLKAMKALKIYKKTENLLHENENLENQIKDITEKTYNLKRQFSVALEKVRDSAEMKVAFLDKKINLISNKERNKTVIDLQFPVLQKN